MGLFVSGAFRVRDWPGPRRVLCWWTLFNVVVLAVAKLLIRALISGRILRQPNLILGPVGSWPVANINLCNWHQTDAPSSLVAAFFLFFAGASLIVNVILGFTIAVRRLHDSNLFGG